jgi:hypothetical protein
LSDGAKRVLRTNGVVNPKTETKTLAMKEYQVRRPQTPCGEGKGKRGGEVSELGRRSGGDVKKKLTRGSQGRSILPLAFRFGGGGRTSIREYAMM